MDFEQIEVFGRSSLWGNSAWEFALQILCRALFLLIEQHRGTGVCIVVIKRCVLCWVWVEKACVCVSADESLAGEVYLSDEEDYTPAKSIPAPQPVAPQSVDVKME